MFKCKDPLSELLKEYGYNLVAFPKPDIKPLQILIKDNGRLERIGQLKELFENEDMTAPTISKDKAVAQEMQNKKTATIKAKFGIDILSNLLNAMGGKENDDKEKKKYNLDGVFEDVDGMIFSYKNVLVNEVSHIKLDAYINSAKLNEKAKSFVQRLKNDEIYIITSVLKSNSFRTEFIDKGNKGISASVPQIKKLVDIDISVGLEKDDSNIIVYESPSPLIFGFKAVRLFYEEKTDSFRIKNVENVVLRGEEDFPVERFNNEEAFIEL